MIASSTHDPRRFEVVFERHYPAVARFVAGRIGSSDAPDVAAETFVRAFERRHRFRTDQRSALPWLFGIAVNLIRERNRKAVRRDRAYRRSADPMAGSIPFEPEAVSRVDAAALGPRLKVALDRLSDEEYRVLMLAASSDLSYAEIAQGLGVPIGTVRSRLFRARQRMRELMEAQGSIQQESSSRNARPAG